METVAVTSCWPRNRRRPVGSKLLQGMPRGSNGAPLGVNDFQFRCDGTAVFLSVSLPLSLSPSLPPSLPPSLSLSVYIHIDRGREVDEWMDR